MVDLFTAPSVGIDGVKEGGKEEAILAGTQPVLGAPLVESARFVWRS